MKLLIGLLATTMLLCSSAFAQSDIEARIKNTAAGLEALSNQAYKAASGYKFARSVDEIQYMVDNKGQPMSRFEYHKENITANCNMAFGGMKAIITGSTR